MNQIATTGYRPQNITRTVITHIAPSQKIAHVSRAKERFTLVDVQGNEKPIGLMDDKSRMYMDVAVIDAAPTKVRAYFSKPFTGEEGVSPDCASDDNIRPNASTASPVHATCQGCPMNAWGSGKNGSGKACAEKHNLAVITVNAPVNMVFQFQVPPASLGAWGAYCSSLEKRGIDITDAVTRILFDPQQQGRLLFELTGQLQPPFTQQRDTAWASLLTLPAIGADRAGTAAPATALPPPVQQQAPQISAPIPPIQLDRAPQQWTSPETSPPGGYGGQPQQPTQDAPKRTRRTKAQIEADNAAAQGMPPNAPTNSYAQVLPAPVTAGAVPAYDGFGQDPADPMAIPSFLQRTPPPASPPLPSPVATPSFGMQPGTPAPSPMEQAVAAAMALRNQTNGQG